jgi:GNAT superfamily N-acetyltransferase
MKAILFRIWQRSSGLSVSPVRRVLGFSIRALQSKAVYRKMARQLLPGFTVTAAIIQDLKALQRYFGLLFPEEDPAAIIRDPNASYYVARSLGTVVGFICLARHTRENHPYAGFWFYGLQVRYPWRRLGVGEELVRIAIERAAQEGAAELCCLVFTDNHAALDLYIKLGFMQVMRPEIETSLQEEHKSSGRRRVVLCKPLTPGNAAAPEPRSLEKPVKLI